MIESEIKAKVALIVGFVFMEGVMVGVEAPESKTYRGAIKAAEEIHALYAGERGLFG